MKRLLTGLGALSLVTLPPALTAALVLHALLALAAPAALPPYSVVFVWTWALATAVAAVAVLIQGPPPAPPATGLPATGLPATGLPTTGDGARVPERLISLSASPSPN